MFVRQYSLLPRIQRLCSRWKRACRNFTGPSVGGDLDFPRPRIQVTHKPRQCSQRKLCFVKNHAYERHMPDLFTVPGKCNQRAKLLMSLDVAALTNGSGFSKQLITRDALWKPQQNRRRDSNFAMNAEAIHSSRRRTSKHIGRSRKERKQSNRGVTSSPTGLHAMGVIRYHRGQEVRFRAGGTISTLGSLSRDTR